MGDNKRINLYVSHNQPMHSDGPVQWPHSDGPVVSVSPTVHVAKGGVVVFIE